MTHKSTGSLQMDATNGIAHQENPCRYSQCYQAVGARALLVILVGEEVQTTLGKTLLAVARNDDHARHRKRDLVERKHGGIHEQQGDGTRIGRNRGRNHQHDNVDIAPGRTELGVWHDVEDSQVENDQRQLERHAKADNQQNLDIDIVLEIRKDRGDGIGLAQQPLKARRNDDEIAKDRTDEEQRRGSKNRHWA